MSFIRLSVYAFRPKDRRRQAPALSSYAYTLDGRGEKTLAARKPLSAVEEAAKKLIAAGNGQSEL